MRRLLIAICDDDIFFANDMKKRIENILEASRKETDFGINVFTSASELLTHYSDEYCACFLDICIDKENGIEAGIRLKEKFPETILVFVTSFIDFSLDGYKANAFRYILKDSIDMLLPECIDDMIKRVCADSDEISFTYLGNNVRLNVAKIVYIESFLHHQTIHVSDGQSIETRTTMADFEEQLRGFTFVKSHKSFLVNCRYISAVSGTEITLDTGDKIPVAQRRIGAVKEAYAHYLSRR